MGLYRHGELGLDGRGEMGREWLLIKELNLIEP